MSAIARLVRAGALGMLVAAIARELRRPAGERTWHGRVAGVVPYDLRPPTVDRVLERVWNPDEPRVLVPQPFGVGWTVNLARLLRRR
jgi:hypothetical protein